MNLAEAIARQARHRPHRTAIVQGERLVSFRELQRMVLRVAALPRNAAGKVVRRELAQRVRIAPARPTPGAA